MMQLIQAKVRCLKGVADSGWFRPGGNTTLLLGQNKEAASQVLRGLEALNPLYNIVLEDPLKDHQETWQQGEHQRFVLKEKKTAVYTIFAAEAELVKALASFDESLIETDRIELGRRLDYSRWISFVELSASARWGDIAEAMHALYNQLISRGLVCSGPGNTFFNDCRATDRIKGDLAVKCREWLLANKHHWAGEAAELYKKCMRDAGLHERFKLAWEYVEESLPPMIRLQPANRIKEKYSFTETGSATADGEPMKALLQQFCTAFDLEVLSPQDRDRLKSDISEIVAKSPFTMSPVMLSFSDSGIVFEGVQEHGDNLLARRVLYLLYAALFTQLLWQRFPIFLLDGYDAGLSDREKLEFADILNELGRFMQILVAPDRGEDWQNCSLAKILRVNGDGVVGEEF